MNKLVLSLLSCAAASLGLAACDGKSAANEKNFGITLTQYLAANGDLCLDPVKWPVDVYETDMRQQKLYPDGVAGQMAALEAAGLARGEDIELPGTTTDARLSASKVKVRRYTATDAAKAYLRATPAQPSRMCLGRKSLDKVVRWTTPAKAGDRQEAAVVYTYRLSGVPAWARTPRVKEAFPTLGRTVDGEHVQKEKLYVKPTPQGWVALEPAR